MKVTDLFIEEKDLSIEIQGIHINDFCFSLIEYAFKRFFHIKSEEYINFLKNEYRLKTQIYNDDFKFILYEHSNTIRIEERIKDDDDSYYCVTFRGSVKEFVRMQTQYLIESQDFDL